jgi:hypothetical protein
MWVADPDYLSDSLFNDLQWIIDDIERLDELYKLCNRVTKLPIGDCRKNQLPNRPIETNDSQWQLYKYYEKITKIIWILQDNNKSEIWLPWKLQDSTYTEWRWDNREWCYVLYDKYTNLPSNLEIIPEIPDCLKNKENFIVSTRLKNVFTSVWKAQLK